MKGKNRSPWSWVPSLYFAEGIPYAVVATTFALIMYKRLGLSNADAAFYTSWLYLPWVIKPFWSPFVDIMKTKRWWIVAMQSLIAVGLAGVAFSIPTTFFLQCSLALLWLVAFSSATHDISADGFYMIALNEQQQSLFVGIRSTFYRISMIVGQGALVMLAGHLENMSGLDPVVINVSNESIFQKQTVDNSSEGLCFVYDKNLFFKSMSAEEAKIAKDSAEATNARNGFVSLNKEENPQPEKIGFWQRNISDPLKEKLSSVFREGEAHGANSPAESCAITTETIRLSQKPGKEIVLNIRQTSGDKSISLLGQERYVFNDDNWDKPLVLLFQLDPRAKETCVAEFTGSSGDTPHAWSITFFICAALFICLALYHFYALPKPDKDKRVEDSNSIKAFFSSFGTFFSKKGIGLSIAFVLLYRLGEAQLTKIASPFLLDSVQDGGLGLSTSEIGFAYGTVGVIALTIGGILGGIIVSRDGLRKWLWPMVLSMNVPNLLYVYMSITQPDSYALVCGLVGVEQFGYGFGFTAFMLYLIYISRGEYSTSHYAICTGLMALGMMLPGMIAGWLQECVGYSNFFVWVCICTIPGMLLIKKLKVEDDFGKK
ncbi:MAG: MFS transporter [Paludibacteraceae bacterium]|nr:MFS transporter [Paludibacteraceae bacterium]